MCAMVEAPKRLLQICNFSHWGTRIPSLPPDMRAANKRLRSAGNGYVLK
jgi:hypothetical protein